MNLTLYFTRVTVSLVVLLTLTGCSDQPDIHPVTGIVRLDGEPLEHIRVIFEPLDGTTGPGGGGMTDQTGSYVAKAIIPGMLENFEGLGTGTYRVSVQTVVVATGQTKLQDGAEVPTYMIPKKKDNPFPDVYGGSDSPLRCTVPEGGCTYDIPLPRRPAEGG